MSDDVKFTHCPMAKRTFDTFNEADKAARRRYGAEGSATVYAVVSVGPLKRLVQLAAIHRLQNGRLVTDLTFEGCKYA